VNLLITAFLFLFLSPSVFASEEMVIEGFEYGDLEVARGEWIPQGQSPPVDLLELPGNLIFRCGFSGGMDRCYWDKAVELNLINLSRIELKLYVEKPEPIGRATIYFKSGNGWYAGWFSLGKRGWQTISIPKSSFEVEGDPTGWHDIQGIRISFWRASDSTEDTELVMGPMKGFFGTIAVVRGNSTIKKGSPESQAVRSSVWTALRALQLLGDEICLVDDTELEASTFFGFRIAIFPYNPDISEGGMRWIRDFVGSGGKIMVFYSLPDRELMRILGISGALWRRAGYDGEFEHIGFREGEIEGAPALVRQGSRNATVPEIEDGRVVGEWVDISGKGTGIPAVTISKNGAFVGHVPLPVDIRAKERMFLALIAALAPDMRSILAHRFLLNAEALPSIGLHSWDDVKACLKDRMKEVDIDAEAELSKRFLWIEQLRKRSREILEEGGNLDVLFSIGERIGREVKDVFYNAFQMKEAKFKAFWCHSPFGVQGIDWDEAIRALAENGFTAIIPNMLWAGCAYYPSDVLPVADEVSEKGDQIAKCLEASRKYGIEVHIWKVNWNLGWNAPDDFVERLRKEGRLQVDRFGKEVKWLCPSHPDNFKLELDSLLEIVRKYDVDGIHFDYIRYPDGNSCYCQGCKERFEQAIGEKVENWPEDVISGRFKEEFANWRREQITRLVRAVSEEARKIKPGIKISAAVFGDYPSCRDTVGQDWKKWVEEGYLDFVCPMDYTADNSLFERLVSEQVGIVGGKIPVYPGIGASAPGLPPEQVVFQAQRALELGADGFVIFNYDTNTFQELLKAFGKKDK
jgi:uncharacterized lipoprotein YddW (UPF0748 family)